MVGGVNTRVDETYIEVICPLPAECKQEHGYHHGDGQRKNDLNEGTEGSATIHICGFFKFVRNSAEELTKHKDVQTVLKCQTGNGKQNQGCVRVCNVQTGLLNLHVNRLAVCIHTDLNTLELFGQNVEVGEEFCNIFTQIHYIPVKNLNTATCNQTNNTKNVEVTEFEVHCVLQGLVRNDHGYHNQNENEIAAAEFEFCKSVSD